MSAPGGDAGARSSALEQDYVHHVYEKIAKDLLLAQDPLQSAVERFMENLEPGSIVADIGCGNGRHLGSRKDIHCLGTDNSAAQTELVRSVRREEAILADNLSLPYRDGAVDAAISVGVVHHLATRDRRVDALREIARVLRVGGSVLIAVAQHEETHDSQDVLIPWYDVEPKALKAKAHLGREDSQENVFYNDSDNDDDDDSMSLPSSDDDDCSTDLLRRLSSTSGRQQRLRHTHQQLQVVPAPPPDSCYGFVRRAWKRLSSGSSTVRNECGSFNVLSSPQWEEDYYMMSEDLSCDESKEDSALLNDSVKITVRDNYIELRNLDWESFYITPQHEIETTTPDKMPGRHLMRSVSDFFKSALPSMWSGQVKSCNDLDLALAEDEDDFLNSWNRLVRSQTVATCTSNLDGPSILGGGTKMTFSEAEAIVQKFLREDANLPCDLSPVEWDCNGMLVSLTNSDIVNGNLFRKEDGLVEDCLFGATLDFSPDLRYPAFLSEKLSDRQNQTQDAQEDVITRFTSSFVTDADSFVKIAHKDYGNKYQDIIEEENESGLSSSLSAESSAASNTTKNTMNDFRQCKHVKSNCVQNISSNVEVPETYTIMDTNEAHDSNKYEFSLHGSNENLTKNFARNGLLETQVFESNAERGRYCNKDRQIETEADTDGICLLVDNSFELNDVLDRAFPDTRSSKRSSLSEDMEFIHSASSSISPHKKRKVVLNSNCQMACSRTMDLFHNEYCNWCGFKDRETVLSSYYSMPELHKINEHHKKLRVDQCRTFTSINSYHISRLKSRFGKLEDQLDETFYNDDISNRFETIAADLSNDNHLKSQDNILEHEFADRNVFKIQNTSLRSSNQINTVIDHQSCCETFCNDYDNVCSYQMQNKINQCSKLCLNKCILHENNAEYIPSGLHSILHYNCPNCTEYDVETSNSHTAESSCECKLPNKALRTASCADANNLNFVDCSNDYDISSKLSNTSNEFVNKSIATDVKYLNLEQPKKCAFCSLSVSNTNRSKTLEPLQNNSLDEIQSNSPVKYHSDSPQLKSLENCHPCIHCLKRADQSDAFDGDISKEIFLFKSLGQTECGKKTVNDVLPKESISVSKSNMSFQRNISADLDDTSNGASSAMKMNTTSAEETSTFILNTSSNSTTTSGVDTFTTSPQRESPNISQDNLNYARMKLPTMSGASHPKSSITGSTEEIIPNITYFIRDTECVSKIGSQNIDDVHRTTLDVETGKESISSSDRNQQGNDFYHEDQLPLADAIAEGETVHSLHGRIHDQDASVVLHRYHHLFKEQELEDLIDNYVSDLHILSSFHEESHWCVIAERVRVWTI